MSMGPVASSVLIVDDDARFRAWARVLLERAGYVVVGEAADGASAIAAAHRARPELMLLDLQLPDTDGFAVALALSGEPSPPAIVLTSTRDPGDYGERIDNSGALGFLPKEQVSGEALAGLVASRDSRGA
jgi:CheY-like chemotaxis protein